MIERQMKYVVCYLAGEVEQGMTQSFIPAEDMAEAVAIVCKIQSQSDFSTISIAEIKETYEQE